MTEIPGDHATVRKLLHATMDTLSNGERKVSRALLAQYPTAGLTTVADLAEVAGVSPPTVVRFVTRLGFTGFPAFQRALVHELHGELGSPLMQYEKKTGSSKAGVLEESRSAFLSMLDTTYAEIPESEFNKLVRLICDPNKQIRINGGRFSRVLAEYLVLHLRLLRAGVELVEAEDMSRRTTVADTSSSTVLVLFDYRRYTDSQLAFAEVMAHAGATVCLMTDNWLSPVAKTAKVVIPTRVESASPFDSLVAAMAISETLVAGVTEKLGASGKKRLELVEGLFDQE